MAFLSTIFVAILIAQPRLSSQQQCTQLESSEEGFALIGKTLTTIPAKKLADCFMECSRNVLCMSINFHFVKEECELNSQTKETRPQLYKKREGSIYLTYSFDRVPEPLLGMQAKPAKSCLDILKMNESVGTGDHYWIDPSNRGSPVKVFCDMATDGGGWTIVKKVLLTSSAIPPEDSSKSNYYKMLSSYDNTASMLLVTGKMMRDILINMGFDQIHFYCRKISVGRVVSIITKNTTAGKQVVRYFTEISLSNYPDACGSFDRLPEDSSIISQTCDKWGRSTSGVWRVNKWGYYDAFDGFRLNTIPITSDGRRHEIGNHASANMFCDDGKKNALLNNAGDIWQVSVR